MYNGHKEGGKPMIPLRDSAPRTRFPAVNIGLIMINVLVFFYQQALDPAELHRFILTFGTVPQDLMEGLGRFARLGLPFQELGAAAFPLLTANFLHGGWLHLIGNMIYLWVFGDNIESHLGHLKYLVIYLLLGAGSQLTHVLSDPSSTIPLVGASGSIAGVLGAYFVLFPRSRVLTLVPLGFFITFLHIPAVIFLAFWFILQLFNAAFQGLAIGVLPVAWWAHIGGFILGLIVGVLAKDKAYAA
jgi:membrane associated rhomboid family serine protease